MNVSMVQSEQRLIFVSKLSTLVAGLLGFIGLTGWIFEVPFFKSMNPNWVTMKANTAIGLVLFSVALLFSQEGQSRQLKRFGKILSLTGVLIGLLILFEYAADFNIGIDQMLFKEQPQWPNISHPGRPAPNTAVCFVMIGLGIFFLDMKIGRFLRPSQYLAILTGLISQLAIIGYLYDISTFYNVTAFTGMAVHTAVAIFCLSLGILTLRPHQGIMKALSRGPGAQLLLCVFLVPVIFGWFCYQGYWADFYSAEFALALMVMASSAFLTGITWRIYIF